MAISGGFFLGSEVYRNSYVMRAKGKNRRKEFIRKEDQGIQTDF